MAIRELERARALALLRRFAERVPAEARRQLWYEFPFRGNSVTLVECRPYFRDAAQTTRNPIARFVFDPKVVLWSLQWSDRNGRWLPYDLVEPTRHFSDLVEEITRDPRHVFFG